MLHLSALSLIVVRFLLVYWRSPGFASFGRRRYNERVHRLALRMTLRSVTYS